jgi:primosomal replication protein N
LSGRLLERGTLRYTPAGIPVLEFLVGHTSRQIEAETERAVECELGCVAVGSLALLMAGANLGNSIAVSGFLSARSLKRRTPVLHINKVEFVEGIENGIQAEEQT